tara:strand:- start:1140 stop:1748 length:609 start_codon:yes stop_codon:yes gene_type:complete
MKRLVLFDLDGVLVHSRENMRQSWDIVLAKTDINRTFEDYFALIGRPFGDIMRCLNITSNIKQIEDIYTKASLNFISQVTFFPEVEETLIKLRDLGVKIGVVTSKDAIRTKLILKHLEINFITVQCPDPRIRGKPAPDHILMAMVEAGEDPANTIFVGDMPTDQHAAVRSGVDYVHASWGYGDTIESVYSLNCISDLPDYII